jgi:hypothetical protein
MLLLVVYMQLLEEQQYLVSVKGSWNNCVVFIYFILKVTCGLYRQSAAELK